MTAGERLVALRGAGVASALWRGLASGLTTGGILVSWSGLPSATAAAHLLANGGGPSAPAFFVALTSRITRRVQLYSRVW